MLLSKPTECDFPEAEVSQGWVAPAGKQEAHSQIAVLQCGFPWGHPLGRPLEALWLNAHIPAWGGGPQSSASNTAFITLFVQEVSEDQLHQIHWGFLQSTFLGPTQTYSDSGEAWNLPFNKVYRWLYAPAIGSSTTVMWFCLPCLSESSVALDTLQAWGRQLIQASHVVAGFGHRRSKCKRVTASRRLEHTL